LPFGETSLKCVQGSGEGSEAGGEQETATRDHRFEGTTLTGVIGHADLVVIDSSNPVTGPDFSLGPGLGNAGTIRIGRGVNTA